MTDLGIIGDLLESMRLQPPDALPDQLLVHARRLGAREAVPYVVDYAQVTLVPLMPIGVRRREPLEVEATLGGRAFVQGTVVEADADEGRRLWVPMINGSHRVGVLELVVDQVDEALITTMQRFAHMVTETLMLKDSYGDAFSRARRQRPLELAAEMQWELLPPLTCANGRVMISGVLEPSYEIGGDTFDYALNDEAVHIGVFDAMGHGLPAALLATLSVGAYRNARRERKDLEQMYASIDQVIDSQFGPDRFVTAQLSHFDTVTGQLTWINAGHPPALLLRDANVVGQLESEPTLPAGLGGFAPRVTTATLEPGDQVLWFTDGVTEARSPDGEFLGVDRLIDRFEQAAQARLAPPETLRRLVRATLAHSGGKLRDDATFVLLRWSGPPS